MHPDDDHPEVIMVSGQAQKVLVRSMALRHAVRWVDWPGARAGTVTEAAIVFEDYLRTGRPWVLASMEPVPEENIDPTKGEDAI